MRARTALAVVAAAALGTTACSSDDGGGGTSSGAYSVEAALAEIPASVATGDTIQITTADLDASSEAAGHERPRSLEDLDAVLDWGSRLTGRPWGDRGPAPVFVPLADVFNFNQLAHVAEFEDELGWSLLDVETFVELHVPPSRFSVLTGAFDDESLEGKDVVALDDSLVTAGEGDDGETNLSDRTVARPLGRPLRMARDGRRLAASLSTETIEQWQAGSGETLADDGRLSAVAAALDEAESVSAVLYRGNLGGAGALPPRVTPEAAREILDQAIPVPFDTVGIGWSVADGEAVVTVAYHFHTADGADEALDAVEAVYTDGVSARTREPISDIVQLDQIEADGAVVVATLSLRSDHGPIRVWQMLMDRDLPFVHA